MDTTMKHVDSVDVKFVQKCDTVVVEKLLATKLDSDNFEKVFPKNK